jgi:NAD-dependent SIR2 family protein deacetylase
VTRPNDPGSAPPSPLTQLLQRGVAALVAGDVREASRALRAALACRPFQPVVHFNLAVALRLRGDLPRALGHARLAAELAGSAPAHVLYGVHLQLAGDRDRAQRHFERALELAPSYRLAAMYLALVHREQGRRDDAIAGLERALAPGPGALAPLVAERVRGQLFDLRRGRGPEAPVPTALCSVAVVTEILLPDGTTIVAEPGSDEVATAAPSPARTCDAAEAARLLHGASRVVVLTGAGASAASGLATRKQLWQRYDRDAAVSAVGVARSPAVLWAVVRDFLGLEDHPPGAVHHVIARLPRVTAIVTQNVDDLHQRAALPGREVPVHELHGTLERMLCPACGAQAPHPARHYVREHTSLPPCPACGARLRPDVVLFGEQIAPRVLAESLRAVEACDLLLVVGCAMDVAPASELPRVAAACGAAVVELKRSPSRISDAVGSALVLGPAEETLPAIYECLAELEALPLLPAPPPARTPEFLAAPVVLPPCGESITEVTLARWLRKVGDTVAPGEPIAEFDSDKVTVEIEAPFGGVLRALRFEPSAVVRVGEPIADIEPSSAPGPRASPRVAESSEWIFTDFGPHTAAVRRGIAGLSDARWLSPEGPRAELEARVRALAEAHRGALGVATAPLDVWFTDDADEAFARWRQDWQARGKAGEGPADPATGAWQDAFKAAERALRQASANALRHSGPLHQLAGARVAWRLDELHGEGRSWRRTGVSGAIASLLRYHLARIAARGQDLDPPCPFAPLAAIWGLGVWPFALRGGVMGVYVPHPGMLEEGRHVAPPDRKALGGFVGLDLPPF